MGHSKHTAAKQLLARQRQMTSLMDQDLIAMGEDFIFDKTDWVPLYYDKGYAVTSDCGGCIAYRAASLNSELMWLVFAPGKRKGYHATAQDPHQAIEDARQAWAHRREVRQQWRDVEETARNLVWGREKFHITLDDAHRSPLCTIGIEGFLASIGLSRARRMPGRLAALLMKVEPQMGFVIYEAKQRQLAQRERPQASTAPAMSG